MANGFIESIVADIITVAALAFVYVMFRSRIKRQTMKDTVTETKLFFKEIFNKDD